MKRTISGKRRNESSSVKGRLPSSLLKKMFGTLKKSVAIDFSHYRLTTIQRQLQRRLARSGSGDLRRYVAGLEKRPGEAAALAGELLLSVTEFFRYPSTFTTLQRRVFPALAARMTNRSPVRIWVPGCSTGEEVYSLAIAFNDYCERKHLSMYAQFFGTDLVLKNIDTARAAVYGDKLTKLLSADRLRRYFEKTADGYRVIKQLRDRCVFARHDITVDPPFPNIDLVSCRNVLIYFDRYLQDLALPQFHFCIRPGGFLMLGPSESLGHFDAYFSVVDKKARIFSKPEHGPKPSYQFGMTRNRVRSKSGAAFTEPVARRERRRSDFRETIDRVLCERYAPPGVLVDGSLQVRELFGDTERYLKLPQGEATHKLTRLAREGLMAAVYIAVKEASESGDAVRKENVTFTMNRIIRTVNLAVVPIAEGSPGDPLFLVLFEEPIAPASKAASRKTNSGGKAARDETIRLHDELQETKRHLQAIVDEKEEVNRELWAGNEEIQAVNEELQSMNEELEGAKEELESTNEEMAAMNAELQKSNLDLSSATERLRLSLRASKAGAWDWNIPGNSFEWSPEFYALFDIDPVTTPTMQAWLAAVHPDDRDEAQRAIRDSFAAKSDFVNEYRIILRDRSVRWIRSSGRIFFDGAEPVRMIGLCIDFTDRKKIEEALHASEAGLKKAQQVAQVGSWAWHIKTNRLEWSDEMYRIFGIERETVAGGLDSVIARSIHPDDRAAVEASNRSVVTEGRPIPLEYRIVRPDGSVRTVWAEAGELTLDNNGNPELVTGIVQDITERKRAETALRESEEKYRLFFQSTSDRFFIFNPDGTLRFVNDAYARPLGKKPEALVGKTLAEIYPPDQAAARLEGFRRMIQTRERQSTEVSVRDAAGNASYLDSSLEPVFDDKGELLFIMGTARDVTVQKLAALRLRESEERFRQVSDNLMTGVYIVQDGKIAYVNSALAALFGFERDELIGTDPLTFIFPDDKPTVMENLRKRTDDKVAAMQYQYRALCKNGELKNVEVFGSRVMLNGRPAVIGNVIDHTERLRAETTLRESHEMLAAFIRESPILAYVKAVKPDESRVIYASENFKAMTGIPGSAMIGKTMAELFPAEFAKKITDDDWRVVEGGKILELEENLNGRNYITIKFPIVQAERKLLAGYTIDITERKHIEKMVDLLKRSIDVLSEGAYWFGGDGKFIYVNDAACSMLGYSRDEMLALSVPDVNPVATPENLATTLDFLRTNGFVTKESVHRRKDGVEFPVELRSAYLVYEGVEYFYGFAKDITNRKREEQERAKLEAELAKVQKLESLGVLAGGIAHDFNNLLTGIYGYIDLAGEMAADPTLRQYLQRALNTIDRGRGLTQQLLTFARGGAPVRAVGQLFPFVGDTAQFALSGSNVSVRFDVADGLWPCNFDKNQIGQVIDNIVINAKQAMPGGGIVTIEARNVEFAEKEHPNLAVGRYIRLSIIDRGIGMPREILPRIFDPFYTTKNSGHGLGLATSYSIVNRHGGCIDVESEPGKGSVFHVVLPAAGAAVAEKKESRQVIFRGHGTAVVMDDQEVIRETVRAMLDSLGYEVVCTKNGREAIEFMDAERNAGRGVAIALFDLTVPGAMGGKDAAAEIRKRDTTTPIFVMSGYAADEILSEPAEYGFTASIKKPFRKQELTAMLAKYMKGPTSQS
jgi:PAS domain S-box-containing protein